MSNRDVLTKSRTSLSSLVGMGSKRQVDGLDEEIIKISSQWLIEEKLSKYISGFTTVSNVSVIEDNLVLVEGRSRRILSL